MSCAFFDCAALTACSHADSGASGVSPVCCAALRSSSFLGMLSSYRHCTTIIGVRVSAVLISAFLLSSLPAAGQTAAEPAGTAAASAVVDLAEIKRMEVERLRSMAAAGAIPRARLEQAQAELADAEDNMILRRTLYGTVRVEDFTREQADDMVAAAQRLLHREEERYARTLVLVQQGVVARATLTTMQEDIGFRRKQLDLAKFRSQLVDQLAEYARAEEAADEQVHYRAGKVIERFDGKGRFSDLDFARVSAAFQRLFARPLPVSARGETATHRALGFDHRGRVDVALNPDQREGVWLRNYLQKQGIPYYAFRAAVRGKATAPHIHLGPASLRLRSAD